MSWLEKEAISKHAEELIETAQLFSMRGWTPATSSNFSFRILNENRVVITQSGIDKDRIDFDHLMVVDLEGKAIQPDTAKPSAETLLHTMIYQCDDKIHSVLHVHTPLSVVLSKKYASEEQIQFSGWEIQKAFDGIDSHESSVRFLIFDNDQDIKKLSSKIKPLLTKESNVVGFLLAGHGLYCWGKKISDAKRHVEAAEFLMETRFLEDQM